MGFHYSTYPKYTKVQSKIRQWELGVFKLKSIQYKFENRLKK